MEDGDLLLSAKGIAKWLSEQCNEPVTDKQVHHFIANWGLPAGRLMGKLAAKKSELLKWIDDLYTPRGEIVIGSKILARRSFRKPK